MTWCAHKEVLLCFEKKKKKSRKSFRLFGTNEKSENLQSYKVTKLNSKNLVTLCWHHGNVWKVTRFLHAHEQVLLRHLNVTSCVEPSSYMNVEERFISAGPYTSIKKRLCSVYRVAREIYYG